MPLILGTNSIKDTAFSVDNSVRLDGTDDHFSRTLSQSGNSKAFTFSCWIKRSKRNSDVPRLLHFGGSSASPTHYISVRFRDDQNGRLSFYTEAGGDGFQLNTNRLFRDESAWYHIVVAVNSAATEEIDRQKIYVNGVQETSMSSSTAMSYNADLGFNDSGNVIYLFRKQEDSDHFPGYACEVAYIDGQQLTPTSFGEFDSDSPTHWKPKDFKDDVTFGTNGFYLEFKDSSALGADTSGNGNNFNYNFGATNQSTDTCTNNFCTFTSTDPSASNFTLSEGNCKVNKSGAGAFGLYGTNIMLSKGKWYWEVKFTADAGSDRTRAGVAAYESVTGTSTVAGSYSGFAFTCNTSGRFNIVTAGTDNEINGFNSYSTGDIIQFALDMDNQRLYVGRNGDFFNYSSSATGGDPSSGSGFVTNNTTVLAAPVTPYAGHSVGVSGTSTLEFNFGGNPTFSISSGNSDANGHGNFEYAVPSGYFALCTKNLAQNGG